MDFRIIGLIIAAGVAYWVYNDAQKWGYSKSEAIGWSIGVFLLMIVCLPVYILTELKKARRQLGQARRPVVSTSCEYCSKHYFGNPNYCPHCGHLVRKV